MGSMICLSLNGVEIDCGKNRYWQHHCWLFPPGSLTEIDYAYVDDVVETKPGFETTLGEAHFRLCHLGYSREEAQTKFDLAVTRWNRTADLRLSFSDFLRAIANVEFANLRSEDLGPDGWDLSAFVAELLTEFDTDQSMLEDFITDLDFYLVLRALSDRA